MPRSEALTVRLHKKRKVGVTGDSFLNEIREKELSRNHQVTVKNFPARTPEKASEEIENLAADKSGRVIIHTGTNDFTNAINSLNSIK